MSSFTDLEETAYQKVRAKPLTRIHGRPKWLQVRRMSREMRKQAIKYRVTYPWSSNFGLTAVVVGAARYAADHPTLPAYVRPTAAANKRQNVESICKYGCQVEL